jgi:hypothetical protein
VRTKARIVAWLGLSATEVEDAFWWTLLATLGFLGLLVLPRAIRECSAVNGWAC